jgi:hypothetical protein
VLSINTLPFRSADRLFEPEATTFRLATRLLCLEEKELQDPERPVLFRKLLLFKEIMAKDM